MFNDDAQELGESVGGLVMESLQDIDAQLDALRKRRADILDAWSDRDFEWLASAGIIRKEIVAQWMAALDSN